MAALQYVDIPSYHAILFRRTYADLAQPEALMSRATEWLIKQFPRGWDEKEKTWHFPTTGEDATLTFGYLESEKDKYRYQGTSYQFIGWDELTQFLESQYRFLFGWLRKPKGLDVPLRMRGASNPGGVGHEWVKQRFIIEGLQVGRPFIPAKLADNPYLDHESYNRSLANLDPVTRAQIKNGDWSARQAGSKFHREWFEIVDAIPSSCRKLRFWDMAATEPKPHKDPDWTAGCLMGISDNQTIYIIDMKRLRGTPSANENLVKQTAELDGKSVPVRMEQEPGGSGVKMIDDYRRRVLLGWDFKGIPSTGSKEVRANPVSSQAEAGNIKLLRGSWIGEFLDELEAFPNGTHDDQVDSISGALAELVAPKEEESTVIFDAMKEFGLERV